MTIAILVTAALLLVTKFLDCWTTGRGLRGGLHEANPICRPLMVHFGPRTATRGVFGLAVLIVAVTAAGALGTDEPWYRAAFVALGLAIALVQAGVAFLNHRRLARLAPDPEHRAPGRGHQPR